MLKQIAPGVTRVAALRDPTIASGIGQFGTIQFAAPSLRQEASPFNVRDVSEIAKRVELLREIAPNVSRVALLMNPTNPNVDVERMDAEAGARKLGLETVTLNARNAREIDTAFSAKCGRGYPSNHGRGLPMDAMPSSRGRHRLRLRALPRHQE